MSKFSGSSSGDSAEDWYEYTGEDTARFAGEERKVAEHSGIGGRTDFDRDRARVLHSAALRRLADKTQVVGPGDGDIPRTRLTHSLEVAQISRSIAIGIGANADLCDLAGLAHDIGHPPYGHNGERALNELARNIGGFEGNAQTFRILTRLEPKTFAGGRLLGLNLTRASLDAATKYPWVAGDPATSEHKFGAYPQDTEIFRWMRAPVPAIARCIEAQIMDFSDDIAYSVHDVEDGLLAGRIDLRSLADPVEVAALAEQGASAFSGPSADQLAAAAQRLNMVPVIHAVQPLRHDVLGIVALKALTSELVGHFVSAVISETLEKHGPGPHRRYRSELALPPEIEAEVVLLKTVALRYVMSDQGHRIRQDRQRDRIHRVADYLQHSAPASLDPVLGAMWRSADNDSDRQRVIVDQIAVLTESRLERIDKAAAGAQAGWG